MPKFFVVLVHKNLVITSVCFFIGLFSRETCTILGRRKRARRAARSDLAACSLLLSAWEVQPKVPWKHNHHMSSLSFREVSGPISAAFTCFLVTYAAYLRMDELTVVGRVVWPDVLLLLPSLHKGYITENWK